MKQVSHSPKYSFDSEYQTNWNTNYKVSTKENVHLQKDIMREQKVHIMVE